MLIVFSGKVNVSLDTAVGLEHKVLFTDFILIITRTDVDMSHFARPPHDI